MPLTWSPQVYTLEAAAGKAFPKSDGGTCKRLAKAKQATSGKNLEGARKDLVKVYLRENHSREFLVKDVGHFAQGSSKAQERSIASSVAPPLADEVAEGKISTLETMPKSVTPALPIEISSDCESGTAIQAASSEFAKPVSRSSWLDSSKMFLARWVNKEMEETHTLKSPAGFAVARLGEEAPISESEHVGPSAGVEIVSTPPAVLHQDIDVPETYKIED